MTSKHLLYGGTQRKQLTPQQTVREVWWAHPQKLAKFSKQMDVWINSKNLKQSSFISLLQLIHKFKIACGRNGIHEDAAMCLLQHFMKDTAKDVLAHSVCIIEQDCPQ